MYVKMFTLLVIIAATGGSSSLNIIDRAGWKARPPKATQPMTNPVPYVIIHHSQIPGACTTKATCAKDMRAMQNYHMDHNGWNDIGYSFAVGGDGNAYEGRGWSKVGAHAPGYNARSVGICLIGNWMNVLPPKKQLEVVQSLILLGVEKGYISEDYKLLGHRQVRDTDCPGDRLFEEIETWSHFDPKP